MVWVTQIEYYARIVGTEGPMWRAIHRAGAAFRLRSGSGHSSARQRDESRATSVTAEYLDELMRNCDPDH